MRVWVLVWSVAAGGALLWASMVGVDAIVWVLWMPWLLVSVYAWRNYERV